MNILILESLCDVLYECVLNSTEKLQINKFLSFLSYRILCVLPAMTYGAETLTKQAQDKLAAAQTKMERSMLNITYKDRMTNIWVRERTKVIDIIYTVRKMKWSWARHINRLKDNRWTSRVTTWRPYDKKRRQGRPAKRWRDDLDKYWSDTIWQRTAQDRVIWRRHAEVFAQPGHNSCLMMMK